MHFVRIVPLFLTQTFLSQSSTQQSSFDTHMRCFCFHLAKLLDLFKWKVSVDGNLYDVIVIT